MIKKLFEPIDNSPLVVFRIIFGILITAECWGALATGWVKNAFIIPEHTFPFIVFDFLQPLPGDGMYYYYFIMGLCGVAISVGWYYRINMMLFALMWAATYFMQKSNYNNHYYLLMLLNFLMVIVPANAYASLDVKRNPDLKKLTCPRWCILMYAVQMSIVYFYAGIAKLNPDWLMTNPVAYWMQTKSHFYVIGPLLALPATPWIIAYGGIAFDLFIAQGLWFKKTRKAAFICSVLFHLINSAVFQVGVFPYLGVAITVFFFPPDKIRRIFFKNKPQVISEAIHQISFNKPGLIFLIVWFAIQLTLPLRHLMYPGNVNWTEEGHRMSWRMMLRQKMGSVKFRIVDNETGEVWEIKPTEFITPKQSGSIAAKPDMAWQFVQILKKEWKEKGYEDISIYAISRISLNSGPYQPLYDPDYDLAKAEWEPFKHSEWVMVGIK